MRFAYMRDFVEIANVSSVADQKKKEKKKKKENKIKILGIQKAIEMTYFDVIYEVSCTTI